MTLRDWTDHRDGGQWTVWLEPVEKLVISFKSEKELHTVVLDSNPGLEDRSDEELLYSCEIYP